MLNSGSAKLDHILSLGKLSGDHHGVGYTGECSTSKIVFVKGLSTPEFSSLFGKKSRPTLPRHKPKRFVPTSHYCSLLGHIWPRCFK